MASRVCQFHSTLVDVLLRVDFTSIYSMMFLLVWIKEGRSILILRPAEKCPGSIDGPVEHIFNLLSTCLEPPALTETCRRWRCPVNADFPVAAVSIRPLQQAFGT